MTVCPPILGDMHAERGVLARKAAMPTYCEALSVIANTI